MFPRKITTLHEDMSKLGLAGLVHEDINGKPAAKKPMTESTTKPSAKSKQQVTEAKAKIVARKARAAKIRESRMAKKKATFETRLQRIQRQSKKTGIKVEFKVRLVKGLQKRATVMESYDVRKALGGKTPSAKALAESFMKVAGLAGTLGRAFGVLEHFMGEAEGSMGIPVMHADSAYGYDTNVSNAANSDADGEVTDYGSEKEDDEEKPEDDIVEDDVADDDEVVAEDDEENKDDEVQTEDDEVKADDDVQTEDDEEKDDEDAVSEDDEEKKDDEDAVAEAEGDDEKKDEVPVATESRHIPMDFELHAIRLEAEEMAAKVVDGSSENINLGYASDLMNDMVSYLGGAMKLYAKLQQSMKDMGYVGQDQPKDAGGTPVPTAEPNTAVIGQAQPQGTSVLDATAAKTEAKKVKKKA